MRHLFAAICLLTACPASAEWNAAPWLADLSVMREAMLIKYANRVWLEKERGIPIDRAFERLQSRLSAAGSDAAARAVLDRFVRQIADGHVGLDWPSPSPAAKPMVSASTSPATVDSFCAAQGYADRATTGVATLIPGYRAIDNSKLLPIGIAESGGARVGIVRIDVFDPHGFPSLCHEAVAAKAIPIDRDCDAKCSDTLITEAYRRLSLAVIERLEALHTAGAEVLLVDITGNGGGSEWAEAAARMLTQMPLRSARVGVVRGAHWASNWQRTIDALKAAMRSASRSQRLELTGYLDAAESNRRIAETACDPAAGCDWLAPGGYAVGLVPSAADNAFAGKRWAVHVFNPAQHAYRSGVWSGPLVVLTDDETWSAAEQFAALLQDNRAAVLLGSRTGGAGCGYTWGGTPTTLPNSKAIFRLPDCVRFRADGSNEVAGVIPDVLIGWRHSDSLERRGGMLQKALPEAIKAAKRAR